MKSKEGILILVVFILTAVVAYTTFGNKNKGTFNKDLISIDTTKITDIIIYPPDEPETKAINFTREADQWLISSDSLQKQAADYTQVKSMLNMLATLSIKSLAAKGENAFSTFEVANTNRRVVVKYGKKTAADLYIGKLKIAQPNTPPPIDGEEVNPFQAQQRPTLLTFVRLNKDDKIYAVEGMLGNVFNRKAEQFLPPVPKSEAAPAVGDSTIMIKPQIQN